MTCPVHWAVGTSRPLGSGDSRVDGSVEWVEAEAGGCFRALWVGLILADLDNLEAAATAMILQGTDWDGPGDENTKTTAMSAPEQVVFDPCT